MNQVEKFKFEIEQLRQDKIIYATEACATTLICFFVALFLNIFIVGDQTTHLIISALPLLIALGYTLYMGVGNFNRLQKVKKLEKQLYSITR